MKKAREILEWYEKELFYIWQNNYDEKETREIAIQELKELMPKEDEIAKIITLKCKEITAEWWEKDAEVYAKAIHKLINERLDI